MRAVVVHAARDLRVEERAIGGAGPGQVVLRIERGGICGSDLHYFNHGGFGTVRVREPMVLGHEVSGRIVELGAGVSGLAVGELVAVNPSRPCGKCRFCDEGLYNQCLDMRFYGSAMPMPHIQGAFQEVLVADASQCVPADGLSAAEAALAEPLSVCLHAVRQAGDLLGKKVLVTGSGPIGVLTVLVARRAGAGEIVATDIADFTLGFAEKAGADRVVNTTAEADAMAAYSEKKGYFDVQFECSGAAPALAAGIAAVRPRGTIVHVGMGGDKTVPMQAVTTKELTLRGTFRFHEEFAVAVSLMQKGLIDARPLITHVLGIDEAVAAFELATDRSRAMKVQLQMA